MSESKPASSSATSSIDYEKYSKQVLDLISTALPVIIAYTQKAWKYYKSLPENYIQLLIGVIFCFFGGIFPVLFAAIEAAKHGGISTVVAALSDLSDEAMKIIEASKKDDEVDKDGDGKKDVKQMDAKALVMRKTKLVLVKMNPEKLNKAIASIYKVWLSVVAVLSMRFAKTIALSVSISEFLKRPSQKYLTPHLNKVVPNEYQKWVPVILGWITKSISMSIAWFLSTIITAVTSALTGSLMISRALLSIAHDRGISLSGFIPKDHDETYIDEAASYAFALMGIWFQFKHQFDVPFPLNLFLWPVEICEYLIRWSITNSN